MIRKGSLGLVGSFLFALGATIVLFISLISWGAIFHGSDQSPFIPPTIVLCFFGFFLVATGVWLILGKR